MRVLMLLVKDLETRSVRAANALLDAGHEVEIICRDTRDADVRRRDPACRVTRLGIPEPLPLRAGRLLTVPFPGNPVYGAAIARALLRFRPDVIHVHDLPLVLTAYALGGARHPVVFDLHENYPAMVRTWQDRGPLHRALLRSNVYDRWERLATRASRQALVVCEEQRDRLIELGMAPEAVTVIGNTPDLTEWRHEGLAHDLVDADPEDEVVFYSGLLAPIRGIDRLISAMPHVLRKRPRARLVIAGQGESLAPAVSLARRLDVESRVTFLGWVGRDALRAWSRRADVCAVPHRRSDHTDTTYPNKIFEFMAFERPVLVSDARPLARIVNEPMDGPAGIVVEGEEGWGEAILTLLGDPDEARRMGARGRKLVETRYNARVDMERLVDVYDRLEVVGP